MRSLFLLMAAGIMCLTGCIKDDKGCTNVSPADEEAKMLAFAAANGITATKHSSGMYYQIITKGIGTTPNINSEVTVNYTGTYLDGVQFDKSSAPVTFPLRDVIQGWIVGIPLINKGGRIKMIVPSAMAYGCNGARTIPSNAVLYFDVELVDVK